MSGAVLAGALLVVGCGSAGSGSTTVAAAPSTVTATTTVVKTVRSTTEETVTSTVTVETENGPVSFEVNAASGVHLCDDEHLFD